MQGLRDLSQQTTNSRAFLRHLIKKTIKDQLSAATRIGAALENILMSTAFELALQC